MLPGLGLGLRPSSILRYQTNLITWNNMTRQMQTLETLNLIQFEEAIFSLATKESLYRQRFPEIK